MTRRRTAGQPARLHWEERGRLRLSILARYDDDAAVHEALVAFLANHHEAIVAGQSGVWDDSLESAADELSQDLGLDRFIEPAPLGRELVLDWCGDAVRLGRTDVRLRMGFGGYEPDIGETVQRSVTEIRVEDGPPLRVIDEDRRPIVRIALVDDWDPRRETRRAARERLAATLALRLDAELDRIEAEALGAGYTWSDTRPAEEAHLDLLYEAIRGDSVAAIAQQEYGPAESEDIAAAHEEAVRVTLDKIAKRAGVRWRRPAQ